MSVDVTKLPKLGFGLMRLPEKDGEVDIARSCGMVDEYIKHGLNYFDTAYVYSEGKAESIAKKVLVDRYPRESYFLATKLPQWMMNSVEDRDRIFEEQLESTGAGYFDFYLLHSIEEGPNFDGYVKYDCFNWAMQKKAEGKIRHFGFSFHGTPELLEKVLNEHPEVEFVQIQLNYADWDNPIVHSGRLYQILKERNIPVIVMEPVKGGILANVQPEIEQMFKSVRPDASAASWALRFAASLDGVATVLSGMSTEEQMADNLATIADFEPLSESEHDLIRKVVAKMQSIPTVPCTNCRYCVAGCPQSILIPDIFKSLNVLRVYSNDDRPKFFYNGLVEHSGRAKDCIECGQCEGVCPQHLHIIELLKEASQKLDN